MKTQTKGSLIKQLKRYCSEDASLIQGYDEFMADESGQLWDCHHRNELNEDGTFAHTRAELIALGLYYHRPASELILLPHSEHMRMHNGKGKSPEMIEANKEPKSEFGFKFREHFGTRPRDDPKSYIREYLYYHRHGHKCRWEMY